MVPLVGITMLLAAHGCAIDGLSFIADDRVSITEPRDSETVELPLEITWTARDVDATFAVFVDRAPMSPREDLMSLVARHDPCRARSSCESAEWLEDHGVYLTKETSLTIAALPDLRHNNRSRDRHEITIVLLDENGRRTGESAFIREFVVDRDR